jgi:hypothetical protein
MKPAEAYILNQPEPYREILLNLQVIIENALPELELLYKWRIPYYYYKGKPFCFFNASYKGNYVDVAFNKGFQLTLHTSFLISEKRNTFKSLRYFSLEEINFEILSDILFEQKKLF